MRPILTPLFIVFFLLSLGLPPMAGAQDGFNPNDPFAGEDDDLNIGGDIFSDFNEDIEAAHVMEDERFFRYGRLFSFQISLGLTTFDGNRGAAYENDPPSYGVGVNYFSDFQSSYGVGFEFSRHNFFVDVPTVASTDEPIGLVDVSMLRFYFNYRYYVDTSNLGTAITYSNPYFVGRVEYWYVTNKFRDQEDLLGNDSGGGLGFGLGFGLEFPIKLKETYLGVEFLWHTVNFHDKFTQDYRPANSNTGGGYEDLTGNVYSIMASYVISW